VTVLGVDAVSLTLEWLPSVTPTPSAAFEFGSRLAATHDAGAEAFGAPPAGWTGHGYFGPLQQPLPMSLTGYDRWGVFYARERLRPMAQRAGDVLSKSDREVVGTVIARCEAGDFDDDDRPARLHGDLWSGNVLWTSAGATLIDPAAHGGHRETDIAMLALFGCPHLESIVEGYQSRHRLRDGWRDRLGLHQLYALLAHVVLFGSGYRRQTVAAASGALELAS
jgi:fructosamine-3-kinase